MAATPAPRIELATNAPLPLLRAMTDTVGGDVRRPRRWIRYALAAGLVALIVVLILRSSGTSELDRRLAGYRAAGEPVTLAELDAWYPHVPEGSNGAIRLIDAVGRLREEPAGRIPWTRSGPPNPKAHETIDPELLADLGLYVATNASVTAELRAALKLPSRYPMDYKQGLALDIAALSKARRAGQHLIVVALEASGRAHANDTLMALKDGYAVSSTFAQTPTVISQLVRVSLETYGHSSLEGSLNRVAFDDEQLRELDAVVASLPDLVSCWHRGFAGERAYMLPAFSLPIRQLAEVDSVFAPSKCPVSVRAMGWAAYKGLGLTSGDRLALLDGLDLMLSLRETVLTNAPVAEAQFNLWFGSKSEWLHPITQLLVASDRTLSREARNQIERHCARIALAALRFRLAHGNLPESLDELVPSYLPAVPIDPWSGKPMRWVRENSGFVVYSIGQNLKDDGGSEKADLRLRVSRENR
jgi:hypothetical protein